MTQRQAGIWLIVVGTLAMLATIIWVVIESSVFRADVHNACQATANLDLSAWVQVCKEVSRG